MTDADALLREGDVSGARAALVDIVRARPADDAARMFLFQLLAINGEWDKALNQLQSMAQLAPQTQMLSVTYHQAIEAEKQRAAVFAGTAELELLAGKGGWADGVAAGISMIARGETAAGIAVRDAAFDEAPDMAGTIDGTPFEWIADADSRFGPTFEVVLGGRYGILSFDLVESIKSEGPRDLRDTIWYPVEIAFKSGQSYAALMPARYPGSESADEDAIRLGRKTAWAEHDWGTQGLGQRLWMLSDGSDRGLLELRHIEFH